MAKLMKKWQRVFWLSVMCLLLVVGGVNVLSAHAAYRSVYDGSYGSELSDAQKAFYDVLLSRYYSTLQKQPIDSAEKFTYELKTPITFEATVSGKSVVQDENYQAATHKLEDDLAYAYWAFVYDYPEVFWLGDIGYQYSVGASYDSTRGSYVGMISKVEIAISEAYSGAKSQISKYNTGVASAKASVQSSLKGSTRYDKVKAIHDWVCDKAVYNDAAASNVNNAAYKYAYSSGTVFAGNANVVCEGYAESFKVLCDQFNIPAALVVGHGVTTDKSGNKINKSHMWVYVQMDDDQWYAVDPTWDDQKNGLQETYLLVGANTKGFQSTFASEHKVRNYFSTDPSITYTYPTLSANAYKKPGSSSSNDSQATLAAPKVTVANVSTGVKISWASVSEATGYYVYRSTDTGSKKNWKKIATVGSGTLAYTDKAAVSGTTYYYTVKGYNSSVAGSFKSSSAIKCLSVPTVTVANTSKGVNVTWTKVNGADGYWVYRKSGSSGWSRIAEVNSSTLSYTDKAAVSGTTYYYTAKAYSGSSYGAFKSSSAIKYVAKLATPAVSVENVTTGVKVTWNQINGASGYYVYRKATGESWARIATVKSGVSNYTDKAASSGTTYYYTVRAYDGSTKSEFKSSSAILYLSTTKVTAAKTSAGIKVTWSKVTGATGYYVYRKTANGSWARIATVGSGAASYVDKTAKAGTTYVYTIRAYNGSYRSAFVSSNSVKR